MNHYILIGTFKGTPNQFPEFSEAMEAQHAYLKSYKKKGMLLLSGPKTQGGGGVILIRLDDEDIQHFIDNDPLVKAGIQEYQITSFEVFDILEYAKEW
ncbi:Uncharacterized conserved protein YciI, contains a putative active-site phosphohistidine [Acetitomaculum ruminis DSM 5522]|uniref:Uncharacterized conserved protein YciI, contains a putative active-site phosphohistidine n=1 Tax=Acetitomaculum ruminis DSM 5522 TaxID=1120918 RepID=A0A1I0WQ26_9FIRM|nr:YciI family protein [Acetitomaculum ruminis]SFA90644.1 Uncharacterized conserved protein YciI, contains a putative active-site phosphohistidine [Acetitomaculum ruminis DSM 5522]